MKPLLALSAATAALAVAAGAPAVAATPDEGRAVFGLVGLELGFLAALALIALACIFVPLSRALGLGTVIGYLGAGIVAGIGLSICQRRSKNRPMGGAKPGHSMECGA